MSAWSFLSIPDRQHAGNEGYDDITAQHYSFDSTVPNSRHVGVGDLAVIRTSEVVLGVGWIHHLTKSISSKSRLRCPRCLTTGIKARKSKLPRYRCNDGHEFEKPRVETISVDTFVADYSGAWTPAPRHVRSTLLETAAINHARQHSIRKLSLDRLAALCSTHFGPECRNQICARKPRLSLDE